MYLVWKFTIKFLTVDFYSVSRYITHWGGKKFCLSPSTQQNTVHTKRMCVIIFILYYSLLSISSFNKPCFHRNERFTRSASGDRPTGRYGRQPQSVGNFRSLTGPVQRPVSRLSPRPRPKWTRSRDVIASPRGMCTYTYIHITYTLSYFLCQERFQLDTLFLSQTVVVRQDTMACMFKNAQVVNHPITSNGKYPQLYYVYNMIQDIYDPIQIVFSNSYII